MKTMPDEKIEEETPDGDAPPAPPAPAHFAFVIDRALLADELALVSKVIENNASIPILKNVLIEACENNTVRLTGTDLEVGLIATLPAKVKQPGKITLPAKRLLDTVRKLPADSLTIACLPDWDHLTAILSGPAAARLPGMNAESFPELPQAPPEPALQIPVKYMTELIRRTSFAISAEESRFTLNGALLEANGSLRMVSTDGHRLALAEYPVKAATEMKALIPKFALSLLPQLAKDGTFTVSLDMPSGKEKLGTHLWFKVGNYELVTRRLTGNFPDYDRVIPKQVAFSADINCKEATKALDRARGFSDERSRCVRFTLTPGRLMFHTSMPGSGDYQESVPAICQNDMAAAYRADYVLDFLKRETADRFTFSPQQPPEPAKNSKLAPQTVAAVPALLEPVGALADGLTFKYVVMPMRI